MMPCRGSGPFFSLHSPPCTALPTIMPSMRGSAALLHNSTSLRRLLSRQYCTIAAAASKRSKLMENIPAPSMAPAFDAPREWVVFTDLHMSIKTLPTCLQVLHTVHALAAERDAGILFLGDWWHIRGALPVEPLNAALECLRTWTQPTLMLVGNHDQVTIGGLEHALTPLAAANPLIHVFDRPTLYKDALWLPYRRAHADIADAVQVAVKAAGGPRRPASLTAVFAHADVVGASLNSHYQAHAGLEPTTFPPHIPVWTGHYHKPHTVPGTSICYVGTPYQVSRAEAGQSKRLLVLSHEPVEAGGAATWQLVEEVGLDVGPRHFSVGVEEGPEALVAAAALTRTGDRLRWTLRDEGAAESVAPTLQALRDSGVAVQLVMEPVPTVAPRIEAAEALGPTNLFAQFADRVSMSDQARELGATVLADVQAARRGARGVGGRLDLHSVELQGFGPFRDAVTYSLAEGGLRVVCGRNEDGPGSDSNGAGKTALVMAPLWAITGRGDARGDAGAVRGMSIADVLHDDAANCRVCVTGVANGHTFQITRALKRRGSRVTSMLTLMVDGRDATKAEIRMTQGDIDALVGGSDIVARTVFFGQNDITFLLESHDKGFKTEMGRIVDLQLWEEALAAAGAAKRELATTLAARQQDVVNAQRVLQQFEAEASAAAQRAAAWRAEYRVRVQALHDQQAAAQAAAAQALEEVGAQLPALCAWAEAAQSAAQVGTIVDVYDAEEEELAAADEAALTVDQQDADQALEAEQEAADAVVLSQSAALHTLRQRVAKKGASVGASRGIVQALQRQLEEYQALTTDVLDPSASLRAGAAVAVAAVPTCDRCLQPIDKATHRANLDRMLEELEGAQGAAATAAASMSDMEAEATAAEAALEAARAAAADVALRRQQRQQQQAAAARAALAAARQREAARQAVAQRQLEAATAAARDAQALAHMVHRINTLHSRHATLLEQCNPADTAHTAATSAGPPLPSTLPLDAPQALAAARCAAVEQALDAAAAGMQRAAEAGRALGQMEGEVNPHEDNAARFDQLAAQERSTLAEAEQHMTEAQSLQAAWAELDSAFGRAGIQSYLLEGVVGEMQRCAGDYLAVLAPDMHLALTATSATGGGGVAERIDKAVFARRPDGALRPRHVWQLSGGERRRVALALALGYRQLAASRGRFAANLLVLDEVLQHLDEEGCSRVATLLKALPVETVLVVGQAHSFVTQAFDVLDVVVKRGGASSIIRGGE